MNTTARGTPSGAPAENNESSRNAGSKGGPRAALIASQLLTADQLAERWQIPPSHVYRLTRGGQLPSVRLGRYYRYQLAQVERFEADGGTDERRAA